MVRFSHIRNVIFWVYKSMMLSIRFTEYRHFSRTSKSYAEKITTCNHIMRTFRCNNIKSIDYKYLYTLCTPSSRHNIDLNLHDFRDHIKQSKHKYIYINLMCVYTYRIGHFTIMFLLQIKPVVVFKHNVLITALTLS